MANVIPTPRRTTNDAASADNRDAHAEVTRYELLAENMPSVLTQLRPMATSSDAMVRYLATPQAPRSGSNAERRGRGEHGTAHVVSRLCRTNDETCK